MRWSSALSRMHGAAGFPCGSDPTNGPFAVSTCFDNGESREFRVHSHGDVERRWCRNTAQLATVVIGGLITSPLLTSLVVPAIYP